MSWVSLPMRDVNLEEAQRLTREITQDLREIERARNYYARPDTGHLKQRAKENARHLLASILSLD